MKKGFSYINSYFNMVLICIGAGLLSIAFESITFIQGACIIFAIGCAVSLGVGNGPK